MSIKTRLILEFLVVIGVLLFFGRNDEGRHILSQDIGSVIMCIGLFWTIGIIFGKLSGVIESLLSLTISMGLFIFGVILKINGFFPAIFVFGLYLIFLAWITSSFLGSISLMFGVVGLIMALTGYSLRNVSSPTDKTIEKSDICKVNKVTFDGTVDEIYAEICRKKALENQNNK